MRAASLLRTCAFAALSAGLPACAAHDVHEAPAAPHAPHAPVTPDAPPAPPHLEPLPGEALADDAEANFAEFERLLADKETRLRAAGISLARREEAKPSDSRFAPPPPEPRARETLGDATVVSESKSKKATRKPVNRPQAGGSAATSTPVAGKAPAPALDRRATGGRKDADASAEESELQGGRCQTICDLAASTCELEGRICDLAARHPNEPRYADLCRRAEDDCRVASEACQLCSP